MKKFIPSNEAEEDVELSLVAGYPLHGSVSSPDAEAKRISIASILQDKRREDLETRTLRCKETRSTLPEPQDEDFDEYARVCALMGEDGDMILKLKEDGQFAADPVYPCDSEEVIKAKLSLVNIIRNHRTLADLEKTDNTTGYKFIMWDNREKYARAAYSFSINNGFRQVRSKGFKTAKLAAKALLLQLRRWEAEIEHTIGFQEFMIERSRE